MRTKRIIALIALMGLMAACTHFRLDQTKIPAPTGNQQEPTPVENETTPWPGFPTEPGKIPIPKQISAGQFEFDGNEFAADDGGASNYEPPGTDDYILIPGGNDDLAWALYTFPGLIGDRPTDSLMTILPGGNDDLPLAYWIGVADYTTYSWSWEGPFFEAMDYSRPLNGEGMENDRFVSRTGAMSIVIVADASLVAPTPGNPDGLAEVGIHTSTAITDPNYLRNKPHYLMGQAVVTGGAGASSVRKGSNKVTSDLDPSQYAVVTWDHIPAFSPSDEWNLAYIYQVFRRGPMDFVPVHIGSTLAPEEIYTDPIDNSDTIPPIPDTIPGATYFYYVRAKNDAGFTPLSGASPVTIPMLAPANIRAELNPAGTVFDIEWSASDGAESYSLYLNTVANGLNLVTAGIMGTTYQDSTLAPGEFGFYSVIANGADDSSPHSKETRAYMPAAVLSVDLGSGLMLDFVTVPAGTLQLGSPEAEWMRDIDQETVYQSLDLDSYYISKTEITNEMFEKFIDDGGYQNAGYFEFAWDWIQANNITEPPFWSSGDNNSGPGFPNHPVVALSWAEANAFCNWVSTKTTLGEAKLPSEAEWEYAAEGPTAVDEVWLFPWPEFGPLPEGGFNDGDDGFDMARANSGMDLPPDIWIETCEVTQFPLGRSWCGALNMAGNVWEWTDEDWRDKYPDPYVPAPYEQNVLSIVLRGGAFNYLNISRFRTSARYGGNPAGSQPYTQDPPPEFFPVGFRCLIIPGP